MKTMIATKQQVLINIILFVLTLAFLSPAIAKKNKSISFFPAFLCVLFFCVFSFWGGDYFHYYDAFYFGFQNTHIEPIYTYLAKISPSYSFWRAIIWGGALLILAIIFKSYSYDKRSLFLFFISICLLDFSFGRFSLSVAILVLGFYLISKRKKVIIGIALLAVSILFHRSAAFGIATAIIAIIIPIRNYKQLFFYSVLFGVASYFFSDSLSYLLRFDADSNEILGQVVSRGQHYLEKEEQMTGIGGMLRDILDLIPVYLSLFLYIIMVFNRRVFDLPKTILAFSSWGALMIIVASLFSLGSGYYTTIMYERFMQFSVIPIAVFLSYCFSKNIYKKAIRIILLLGIISSLYTLLYSYHCAVSSI